MINNLIFFRNDIETELQGPLEARPVRPVTPPSVALTSSSTPTRPTEAKRQANPVPQSGISFSERVTAAFNSIPKPVLTSHSNSQSSTLTQEMLRDHDKKYAGHERVNQLHQSAMQHANQHTRDDLVLETQTLSTIAPVKDNYVHNDFTSPTKEKNMTNGSIGFNQGESFADTDYLIPPGFTSPVRKLVKETGVSEAENGPTVRDLLSSLASRWQKSASAETVVESSGAKPKNISTDSFAQSWPMRKPVPQKTDTEFNDTVPSVEQSRYSVTDYFKKYSDVTTAKKEPNTSINISQNSTLVSETNKNNRELIPQVSKIKDTDISLSIISENASEVSDITVPSVATTCTVDEQAFWEGLDQLDADIAKVQQSLKKKMQS